MPQPSHLTSLPFELLESICINLPTVTLCSVALTCHTLHPVAISCLHSTITIAPVPGNSKRSKCYHPDPHTLALRLLADASLGARVRHFTYTNTSATTIVSPRRALPGLAASVYSRTSREINLTNLAPLIDHLYTAPHYSTHARTFPNNLFAAAAALLNWHHYLRCGAAQYAAVLCLALTPQLRSLDMTWAGVGPCAAFAGPTWLRAALPQLETLIVRACGTRGRNGRKGWYGNEEWTFPEWATGGALAAGHPSLKRVEFCGGSAAELGAATEALVAAPPPPSPPPPLKSLELSGCGMPPARLAEVLRVAGRGCAGLEEVGVGLVYPITVPFAHPSTWPVPYSKRKTVVRLGEVGDALRGLLRPAGSDFGGPCSYPQHSNLRTLSVKLDFITPQGSVSCAGGGEVGYNGVEWGVSGRLGTLKEFEKLEYLDVSWVALVGWSLGSLKREVPEDETRMAPGGYLGSVLPEGLKWLTVSDEMASWPAWEWRPVEVVELMREWLTLGKRRGLQGVVWKLRNRNEGFGGTWAWTYHVMEELRSISERAGVTCQFDLGRI